MASGFAMTSIRVAPRTCPIQTASWMSKRPTPPRQRSGSTNTPSSSHPRSTAQSSGNRREAYDVASLLSYAHQTMIDLHRGKLHRIGMHEDLVAVGRRVQRSTALKLLQRLALRKTGVADRDRRTHLPTLGGHVPQVSRLAPVTMGGVDVRAGSATARTATST